MVLTSSTVKADQQFTLACGKVFALVATEWTAESGLAAPFLLNCDEPPARLVANH